MQAEKQRLEQQRDAATADITKRAAGLQQAEADLAERRRQLEAAEAAAAAQRQQQVSDSAGGAGVTLVHGHSKLF